MEMLGMEPHKMESNGLQESANKIFAKFAVITETLNGLRESNPEKFEGQLPQKIKDGIRELSDDALNTMVGNAVLTPEYIKSNPKYYEFLEKVFCERDEKRRAVEKSESVA